MSLAGVPVDFGPWRTTASFSVRNTGSATLTWSLDLSGKPNWLVSASPSSGTTPPGGSTSVSLTANRANLPAGTYAYDLPVRSNGGNATVPITLTVPRLGLTVEPSSVDFGATETQKTLTLHNSGAFSILWSIDGTQLPGWLGATPTSGSLAAGASAVVVLTANRTGLEPGSYTHNLLVTSGGGNAVVPVSMQVPSPLLTVEISAVPSTGQAPLWVFFTATASGGNPPYAFAWDFGDGESGSGPAPGHVYTSPGSDTVTVTVTDAQQGTASDQIILSVLAGAGWSRSFGRGGGWTDYHTYGLAPTEDGGLAFCAEMMHPQRGDYDFWICRLDPAGPSSGNGLLADRAATTPARSAPLRTEASS